MGAVSFTPLRLTPNDEDSSKVYVSEAKDLEGDIKQPERFQRNWSCG